jgi:DNA-binding transcriptional ArsR family regulator
MQTAEHLTNVMKTLADPTRRAVFERIMSEREVTAGSLVARSRVSQPAVSQHLRALRDAGLVSERKEGRNIHYRVRREGFEPLLNWMDRWSIFWNERFDNLEQYLQETQRE